MIYNFFGREKKKGMIEGNAQASWVRGTCSSSSSLYQRAPV
jgi:hypothetical protein